MNWIFSLNIDVWISVQNPIGQIMINVKRNMWLLSSKTDNRLITMCDLCECVLFYYHHPTQAPPPGFFQTCSQCSLLPTELLEFFLNGSEISEFSEFRESEKSLKHELGSI